MTCLLCRYFHAAEPAQHKQDREAGRCQSGCGTKWDQFTAINFVKNHGELQGWCYLHPQSISVKYNHICGDISIRNYFFGAGWGIEPFEPSNNLWEWAEGALQTVLHGSWRRQQNEQLKQQNVELRQQLKHAREISASRLKRLQKTANKHKPEQERPVEKPVYPRLVAIE